MSFFGFNWVDIHTYTRGTFFIFLNQSSIRQLQIQIRMKFPEMNLFVVPSFGTEKSVYSLYLLSEQYERFGGMTDSPNNHGRSTRIIWNHRCAAKFPTELRSVSINVCTWKRFNVFKYKSVSIGVCAWTLCQKSIAIRWIFYECIESRLVRWKWTIPIELYQLVRINSWFSNRWLVLQKVRMCSRRLAVQSNAYFIGETD